MRKFGKRRLLKHRESKMRNFKLLRKENLKKETSTTIYNTNTISKGNKREKILRKLKPN